MVRLSLFSEAFQWICDELEGFLPGDGLPLPLSSLAHSLERGANSIRIVKALQTCNPFRTECPSIDRVQRVPGDVDGPLIDHPDEYSATAHALSTDRGNPSFNTGFNSTFRSRELGPLPEAASHGDGDPGPSSQFQKISSSDLHKKPIGIMEYWNNGIMGSKR
jgi:hypothetical protein